MKFHVLTLFPEIFAPLVEHSMLGRASQRGLLSVELTNIRDYAHDTHSTADDYQFGGGHGMVMKPEPIFEAVESALASYDAAERGKIPVILLSPQGRVLNQQLVDELARHESLVLICGHYAGVDERVRTHLITEEVSIGDYVLTGGELAAMVLIDSVSRFTPGVVGSQENVLEDSITSGLLQHPLYTRPAEYRGLGTPDILLSGHHAKIEEWRRHEALRRTLDRRPDLLKTAELTSQDRDFLRTLGYHQSPTAPGGE